MEQIIATHTIKPSSPTPLKLKIHKLSFLDQLIQPFHVPLIFFYKNDQSKQHTEISRRLRQSLSEILTIFYPIAGTIKGNSFVDCNDRGAEFVEAKVHVGLAQFMQNPKMEELQQLVSLATNDDFILSAKVSYFDCGGFVVGVRLEHKLTDAASLTMFMNAWAATCRGETSQIISPSFDLALHFPPANIPAVDLGHIKEKITTKRLVFEREMLEKIRKRVVASREEVKEASRVEALSTFIWQSAIDAYKSKSCAESRTKTTTSFAAAHAVNLRPRTLPPIPDHTFGNCIVVAAAVVSREEDESERESGVHLSKLRAAIRAVDDDYIINNVVKDSEKFLRAQEQVDDLSKAGHRLTFSSWWKFPMYDVDFGWGKPVWVCTTSFPSTNVIILMSTPSGDGIEAWVNASVDDDQFFQLLQANCNKLTVD